MSSGFVIVNPCPKKWADLRDDGRTRYCDACKTSVHPVGQYTKEELGQVWRESGGHLCGCVDGESTPEPRSRRAVLVGALLTAISPLMAQTGRLRIHVCDVTGAIIPGAIVSLLGTEGKLRTNDRGDVVFTNLPLGDSRFTVEQAGFKTKPLTVTVQTNDELKIDAVLEVGSVGGGVIIEAEAVPEPRRWLIFR
jgi:hypothetical protein